jgi:hypothetical protein
MGDNMKGKCIFVSFTIISIMLLIIIRSSVSLGGKVPYTPIDYNNIEKVTVVGFLNKTSDEIDIKELVKSINEIKKYERKDKPVNHSHPGPRWSIIIYLKDKQSITLYRDYDGQTKISNWKKSYIVDQTIVERVLRENNLQAQRP